MLTGMLAGGEQRTRHGQETRARQADVPCAVRAAQVRYLPGAMRLLPALPEESRMACAPIAPPSPAPRKKNGGLVERVDTTSLRPRASTSLRIHVEDREYLLMRSAVATRMVVRQHDSTGCMSPKTTAHAAHPPLSHETSLTFIEHGMHMRQAVADPLRTQDDRTPSNRSYIRPCGPSAG